MGRGEGPSQTGRVWKGMLSLWPVFGGKKGGGDKEENQLNDKSSVQPQLPQGEAFGEGKAS